MNHRIPRKSHQEPPLEAITQGLQLLEFAPGCEAEGTGAEVDDFLGGFAFGDSCVFGFVRMYVYGCECKCDGERE